MSKAEPELWRLVPSVSGLLASSHGSLMVTPYCAPMPFGGERQYGGEPTQGQWDGKRFTLQLSRRYSGRLELRVRQHATTVCKRRKER